METDEHHLHRGTDSQPKHSNRMYTYVDAVEMWPAGHVESICEGISTNSVKYYLYLANRDKCQSE